MDTPDISTSRRTLLKGGSAAIAAAFGAPIAALASRAAEAACQAAPASSLSVSPYGPIAPVNDLSTGLPILQLPPGFSYKTYGWRGDLMSDGLVTPSAHDGMGVARARKVGRSTEIVLVRNHEQSTGSASSIIGAGRADVAKHDTGATGTSYQLGGTTNIVWRDGEFVESYASFGGTNRNCAGGVSNWGSWLTNEETLTNAVSSTGKRHGYIFEVPADTSEQSANANPILDMGRMNHEASALDVDTGYWYLTEDQGNANTLYRFIPNNLSGGLNSLHQGGRLQGLKVRNSPYHDLRNPTLCQEFAIEWVDIANPDLDSGSLSTVRGSVTASGPYRQAYANGAATFGAGEGCWVANGVVYFTDKAVSTSTPSRAGRIWALDLATNTLKAIFVSNDLQVGNSPDNICVSPRGGLLFNEDGGTSGPNSGPAVTAQRLMALREDGSSYIFAANNYNFTSAQLAAAGKGGPGRATGNQRNTEWCGSCFSPDGRVLFANLQSPGLTVAISGPWAKGTL